MDTISLSQEEAAERAALLEVERYDVDVDLSGLLEGQRLRATSRITFRCAAPGASTFVDCAADVRAATLNGSPVGPGERGRIRLPDLREHNVLEVESVQDDTAHGAGVHRAVDPADGEVYVWMSFEPDECRFVWACFDQPDLKAPHVFTVTAPAGWTVVSNSGDSEVEELADGLRRWSFPATPPLSTYNPVINAGPFHELRREVGGHDLGLFARRSLAAVLERDADELFTVTGQGLGFFADVFGMAFPQRKYDQVFVPEMGGAMENYGCVTWSDGFLRRHQPTPAELDMLAKVLLHEMAHMWFGNIVTMRWWDDLWLNEAFAEFACNWAAEGATSYTDAWASHLAADKLDAYLADQGPISHPIRQEVRDVAEAASIFDAITYPKGASVLYQLMTYVGEPQFRAGMRLYFSRHAWSNTTLQDLIDALAEASGRDLDRWRTGWLETAGTDRLRLEGDGDGHVLVAEGPESFGPRPQVLAIGSYRRTADGLERFSRAVVEVDGPRTPVDLPAADLHLINDDDLTFATSRPDATSRDALFAAASQLPTAISRGVAVATVWDMLLTAEATAAEVVQVLDEVVTVETAEAVVEPYVRLATWAAELWSGESDRDALAAQVTATCRSLAARGRHRLPALRAVARLGGPDDLAWLRDQAPDDVDLLWRVLVRQSEIGSVAEAEVETLLARDSDPDAWVRALTVRAAGPDRADKDAVWQAYAVERTVPLGPGAPVAQAFWRPGQEEVLRTYAEKYLELLPGLDEGGMIPAMAYTHRLFPLFGIDDGYFARVEAAAAGASPVVRQGVAERSDEVRRMLAARGAAG